ncbi:MAG: heavy metal translocating P-type ATPase [Candidatus Micrarchaeota archaeon]
MKVSFDLKNHISAGCSCDMEDKVRQLKGVRDASFDPVNQVLSVEYAESQTDAHKIHKFIEGCGFACSKQKAPHEMSHEMHMAGGAPHEMKHEAHGAPARGGTAPEMHDHHAMMETEFKRHFIIGAVFTVPLLILSPTIQGWTKDFLGISLPTFAGVNYVLFLLASVVALYGALPFYRGAMSSLRTGMLDMMVLVSIAVGSGYLFSVGATFLFEAPDFYWEISTLAVFLLFGHWMEMRTVRDASGALRELVKLIPPKANLVKGDEIIEVDTASLEKGDIVLVRPGEKVPIDGLVVEGNSSVNEAMITGESSPVGKKSGSEAIGGTLNIEGALRMKVTKTGEETALAQIINLVRQAQAAKPPVQKLADRAAHYLTITAILVGLATFLFWMVAAGQTAVFALTLMITVVVVACPHALGLAIPTVTTISTILAARNGILVKNALALETALKLDTVVFDKTGTLTKGQFGVSDIVSLEEMKEDELLAIAAAIEQNSEHVIARGIVAKAKERKLKLPRVSKFEAVAGKGVKAEVGKGAYLIGNSAMMEGTGIAHANINADELASQGKTVVYVASDNTLIGLIALSDIIREESYEAVKALKAQGLKVAMLTGDNKATARYVAKELGLDEYFAEVLPDQKSEAVKGLQKRGMKVAMVGDGVNDAPALVQSDVGIAIGAGTDVAVESAQIVLVKNDPRDIPKLIRLSRLTMRKMKENLVWATGYNVLAIPVAAGILYPWGILLRPEFAALIMAASSIIVVTNALLMRGARL